MSAPTITSCSRESEWSTGSMTYHLRGEDESGQQYFLCLQDWGPGLYISDLRDEFERCAVPGHIPNIVCSRCYDPRKNICGSCFEPVDAESSEDECPHCHHSIYA